jgi:orotidine-5'-phosphate decarboxylase
MQRIRLIVPDMMFLVPGIGAQGGHVEQTIHAGQDAAGRGLILNAARAVIFAPDPAQAARDLRAEINRFRAPAAET